MGIERATGNAAIADRESGRPEGPRSLPVTARPPPSRASLPRVDHTAPRESMQLTVDAKNGIPYIE